MLNIENCCILGSYFRFIVRIADSTLFNLRTTRVENSNTLALACECSLRCTRQKNLYLFSFSSTEAASLSWTPEFFCSSNALCSQNNSSLSILRTLIFVDRNESPETKHNTTSEWTEVQNFWVDSEHLTFLNEMLLDLLMSDGLVFECIWY